MSSCVTDVLAILYENRIFVYRKRQEKFVNQAAKFCCKLAAFHAVQIFDCSKFCAEMRIMRR